jgi:hypothetical protein
LKHDVDNGSSDQVLLYRGVYAFAATDPVHWHTKAFDGNQHVVNGSVCVGRDENGLALREESQALLLPFCCCCHPADLRV